MNEGGPMGAGSHSSSTVQWRVAIAVVVGLLATLLVPPVGAVAEETPLDVFALHSDPGSQKMILLDFDGYTSPDLGDVTTYWGAKMSNITYLPYDLDGDHTTFNDAERDVIHRVWLLVSEAYAPWDVDVTTQEPASLEELQRDPCVLDDVDPCADTDTTWGSRTLITNHTEKSLASGGLLHDCGMIECSGIAQGGAFGAPGPKYTSPSSLVLPHNFEVAPEGDVRTIAQVVIHEVAHNLGLGHDTTTAATSVFKPIMCTGGNIGCVAESRPLMQFTPYTDEGSTTGSARGTVVEDFGLYGLFLRADDHGNDAGSATELAGPDLAAEGIVAFENDQAAQDDQDWFRFTVAQGDTLDLAVTPSPHSMMLDVEATLFDAGGDPVASSNPPAVAIDRDTASGLDATFEGLQLAAGTYFLRVAGSGGVGYTSYGSIGSYTVSGTITAPVPCDPGTYSETGYQPCTAAPAGTFVDTVGATSATPCPVGTFQPDQGADSCIVAPVGSYVDTVGATTATPCLDGYTTDFVGAASADACRPINTPPVAEAGGPYTVAEGSSVALDGSGSDPDPGDTLTYQWDLDGDGAFDDAGGATPVFSAAGRDGPDTQTVGVRVCDQHGECDTDVATVTIDNVAPTITSITAPIAPVATNTPVDVTVPFSDPASSDTHTCAIDWGDGTTSVGSVAAGACAGSHSYTAAGVHTLTVTVTDDDGGSDSEIFEYVVVYDPAGGFVTGGGWIDSPAGAYVEDPTLTGKASFGFVAKYKKGANVPDGNTQFQFKAGDLNFHSSSYEWLVIAGSDAKFKGVGTINGAGNYGFMITATDSAINGSGNLDAFRIKIWDIDNGDAVVYDNQIGESDDSTATTVLGGGNIVIHTKK